MRNILKAFSDSHMKEVTMGQSEKLILPVEAQFDCCAVHYSVWWSQCC